MKLNTVNVIVLANGSLKNIYSFKDNPKGNKEAEKMFGDCIRQTSATINDDLEAPIEDYIEDGYFDRNGHEIYLSHSAWHDNQLC